MRCFYEVLGVEKTADASELKKGYYKASLQWHPDKNHERAEEATLKFQEIMEAYRVLSDAQERAWYDRHRDEIMRGGQGGIGGEFKEERLDVFQYFTSSCYGKFNDEPNGFFSIYRKVFDDIAAEERKASDRHSDSSSDLTDSSNEGADSSSQKKTKSDSFPSFGTMNSDYESVVRPFYAWWEAFVSRKSYAWLEPHDTRHLSCRAERRAAEAENRRHREAARKQRNEEVRQLVAYVQRRDKRIAAERERIALANLEGHVKTKKHAKHARDRNKVLLKAAWEEEMTSGGLASKWAADLEAELARLEAQIDNKKGTLVTPGNVAKVENEDDSDKLPDETEADELYCIACDKHFASSPAKLNHEASKKHRKAVAFLRDILMEEEKLAATKAQEDEKTKKKETLDDDEEEEKEEEVDDDNEFQDDSEAEGSKENDEEQLNHQEEFTHQTVQEPVEEEVMPPVHLKPVPEVTLSQREKKALRRDQRAREVQRMKNGTGDELTLSTACPTSLQPVLVQPITCKVCSEEFESKNQLFTHIKETKHAALKAVARPPKKVKPAKPATKTGKRK